MTASTAPPGAAPGAPTSPYAVRVLGGLEVLADGTPVAIRSRKGVAVVAYLAAVGAPVDRGVLADVLWPERDEASARNNLRVTLATLKRRAPGLIHARRTDLRLADGVTVDRDALLSAWRDRPRTPAPDALFAPLLAGVTVPETEAFEAWLAEERGRWRATLLRTLDAAVDATTAADDAALATALLERSLDVDPWDETRVARVVDAFVAQGRTAAAVRRFDTFAAMVRSEMGIEPDPDLAARVRAARADATPPTAADDPRHPAPRVGQEDALAQVRAALADATTPLLVVRGPPGAGASRLVRDGLAAGPPPGIDGRDPPRVSLEGIEDADAAWARLADALAVGEADGGPVEALVAACTGPTLWWFDDVHGALAPALAPGLATLLERARHLRVVVAGHDAVGWAGERTIDVPPLTPEEGADLLRTFLPEGRAPDGLDPTHLAAWAQGHALALVLTGAQLRAGGGAEIAPDGAPPPAVLREGPYGLTERHRSLATAVATGLQGVGGGRRALLAAVATARAPAACEAVAALLDRDVHLTARSLDAEVRRGAVRVVRGPGGAPHYAPEPAYAWAVSTRTPGGRDAPPTLAARHARWFLEQAREAADRTQGPYEARLLERVGWAMDDVDAALDTLERRDAVEALHTAVALAPLHRRFDRSRPALRRIARLEAAVGDRLDARARSDAAHARGTLALLAARWGDAREALAAALTAREREGDPVRLAETRMAWGILEGQRGAFDEARRTLEGAAALLGDDRASWTRAAVAMNLANVHAQAGADADAVAAFADATRRFHELGDLEGAAGAALGWLGAAATVGEARQARLSLRRLIEVVERMDEGGDVRLAGAFQDAVLRLRDAGMDAYARDVRALAKRVATAFGWADDPRAGPVVATLLATDAPEP